MKLKTLRETITSPLTDGIFFNLATSEQLEYINSDNAQTLNIDYYLTHSKDKVASDIFSDKDMEDEDVYTHLCNIIINRYKNKWDRLYEVLIEAEYNPIENYSMTEIRTPDLTDEKTLNITNERTLDTEEELTLDTNVDTTSSTKTDLTTTQSTNRFGFNDNGSTGSPYEKVTTNVSGTQPNNQTRDVTDNTGTETTTNTGTDTNLETGTDTTTHTGTETLTRSGNIGVTTSQQMVASTIDLYKLNNFVDIIMNDIDKVLTNNIFI